MRLTISKQLVEGMGGEITVESHPGVGSIFTFTLPFGCQMEASTPNRWSSVSALGLKVLVADDSPLAQDILKAMLTSMSFEVTVVNSGKAALQEIEERKNFYDLVLLDWRMPEIDGFETARRIKTRFRSGKIPKIFLVTAYGREELIQQADDLGLDGFLMKPVSESILFNTIMEAFGAENLPSMTTPPQTAGEGEKRLDGSRVLVVEDNEINQQVAQEILKGFGLEVEIAANGKEAATLLEKEDSLFDAVLMDLQMPEMDGYEATRVIRSTRSQETLPIIAMTAHALESEREKCLKAGMNDYVTKPVDPDRLLAALVRWVRPGRELQPKTTHEEPCRDPSGPLPGIDLEEALQRLGGNRTLFARLLSDFGRNHSRIVEEIREALTRRDLPQVRRTVHTLKGMAGNLSAARVYEAAKELEVLTQEGDPTQIEAALEHLDVAFQLVLASAIRLGKQVNIGPESPVPAGRPPEANLERAPVKSEKEESSWYGKPEFTGESTPPLQILLAEDNPINQMVTRTLLKNRGFKADTAANGLEVLDALQKTPYDIILMDCQMPELGGVETAKEIRRRERHSHQKPAHIIAVTADITRENRDRCLKAGMNDFLIKPLRENELQKALARFFQAGGIKDIAPPFGTIQEVSAGDPSARSGIDAEPGGPQVDKGLLEDISGGDYGRLHELIDLYITQAEELMGKIRSAVRTGDVLEAGRMAHKLTGSSASCGITAMVAPLRELELRIKQDPMKGGDQMLEDAERRLDSVRIALRAYLSAFKKGGDGRSS